jgi:hypothetical protein
LDKASRNHHIKEHENKKEVDNEQADEYENNGNVILPKNINSSIDKTQIVDTFKTSIITDISPKRKNSNTRRINLSVDLDYSKIKSKINLKSFKKDYLRLQRKASKMNRNNEADISKTRSTIFHHYFSEEQHFQTYQSTRNQEVT